MPAYDFDKSGFAKRLRNKDSVIERAVGSSSSADGALTPVK
jgi:hypothetical protein